MTGLSSKYKHNPSTHAKLLAKHFKSKDDFIRYLARELNFSNAKVSRWEDILNTEGTAQVYLDVQRYPYEITDNLMRLIDSYQTFLSTP